MDDISFPWNSVVSSNIEKWRYDVETRVLEIKFLSGDAVFSYNEIPSAVAEGFDTAASPGQYFRNNIKDRYQFFRG
jgi:hypothetical protein